MSPGQPLRLGFEFQTFSPEKRHIYIYHMQKRHPRIQQFEKNASEYDQELPQSNTAD